MAVTPHIQPLRWATVRDVLPNEALDFTPWLAANLDLLADALGLEDLELVGTELAVDTFRIDIRALATTGSGDPLAVVIENQYGKTDHDHLGKLVTYAARAHADVQRVLAVWIVEQPVPAHAAAIEFLNQISAEHVGWALVSARFAPAPEGFYVHFEKHTEPNAFLRSRSLVDGATASPARQEFTAAVFGRLDAPLRQAGFRHVYAHPSGGIIRAYLPKHFPAAAWAEVRVLIAKNRCKVVLFVRGGQAPPEYNIEVLEGIRQRHGAQLEAVMGSEWPIEWHARTENDRSDYARITWEGQGYVDGDPDQIAALAVKFASACLAALGRDTEAELPDPDVLLDGSGTADTATVRAIAACIEPGEWATYGDVSTVATGTTSAAMAVGTIAANAPGFPNAHRILSRHGAPPDNWRSDDGGGPEVCRALLQQEGVPFLPNGSADPSRRVDVATLRARWRASMGTSPSSGGARVDLLE